MLSISNSNVFRLYNFKVSFIVYVLKNNFIAAVPVKPIVCSLIIYIITYFRTELITFIYCRFIVKIFIPIKEFVIVSKRIVSWFSVCYRIVNVSNLLKFVLIPSKIVLVEIFESIHHRTVVMT